MATRPIVSSSGPTLPPDELKGSFDPALYNFLFKLYPSLMGRKIDVQSGTDIIYGQYGGSMIIEQEPDDKQLREAMFELVNKLRGAPYFQANSRSPLVPLAEVVKANALAPTGYYWYDSGETNQARKRVYIHANGLEGVVAVMNCLAGEVGGDFRGVKLWGPYWWNKKLDTVVAYCTSEAGQIKVLQAVRPLQATHFLSGLPAFVKMISPGVGIADNPPQVKVFEEDEEVQSFGKFMSKLICLAYIHSEGRGLRDFLRQVLVALRVAQINPLRPHEHSRSAEVERMRPNLYETLDFELRKMT